MKVFQSSLFRALCAVVVGILLVRYPQEGVTWITVAVGVLFLLSGIIALAAYWNARRHASEYIITDRQGRVVSGTQPTFPIVGLGSVILGLTLALTPGVFIHGLMYVLGAIMILGGLNQLLALVAARGLGPVPLVFWVAPSLILLVGLFVLLKPVSSAQTPLLILGWCSLVYGVTEIINSLKILSLRKRAERTTKPAVRQTADEAGEEEVIIVES